MGGQNYNERRRARHIIHYFSDYLNFEKPAVKGRPLLGLLYKQYKSGQLNIEQTTRILFQLKFEATFTQTEEGFIYSLDNHFDLAQDNIYGSIEDITKETERFLGIYKDYSIENFELWPDLDIKVDQILDAERKQQEEEYQMQKAVVLKKSEKPWWKFW